jgi:hypothetical protein
MQEKAVKISPTRLRVGIIIWILSWMPFPTLIVHFLHDHGKATSSKDTSAAYLILWGAQICIGLIGLWLAGKETLTLAKADGWRALPKKLWRIIWRGQQ